MAEKALINKFKEKVSDLCDSAVCKIMPNKILQGGISALEAITPDERDYYTSLEVCDKFGYSKAQLSRDKRDGKIIRIGHDKYDKRSVDEYFDILYNKRARS